MTAHSAVLGVATVLTGLFAGLFATFSFAVMPGLRRTDDATFVRAMRQVNAAIINPVFAVVFLGSVLASILAAVVGYGDPGARPWLLGAALLVVATVAVTMWVNVPLNNALDHDPGDDPGDDPSSAERDRAAFERPWARWNVVRSVLSLGALVSSVLALVAHHS